jgi:aminoglycoside 2''-phosphotransferase
LCDRQAQQIHGVIDWEDARVGDPALDFVGLFGLAGAGFVQDVMGAYQESIASFAERQPRAPFDETFQERILFYRAIIPFHELLYALEIQDADRLQDSLRTLKGI